MRFSIKPLFFLSRFLSNEDWSENEAIGVNDVDDVNGVNGAGDLGGLGGAEGFDDVESAKGGWSKRQMVIRLAWTF